MFNSAESVKKLEEEFSGIQIIEKIEEKAFHS